MQLTSILSVERIVLDRAGDVVGTKPDALRVLSGLLAPSLGTDAETVHKLLVERENLQSTGIGDGVAIPHTSLSATRSRAAALLLCPRGVAFDAIDGAPVTIIFGVIGPREATGEHLRVLARISRVLRDPAVRKALVEATSPEEAYRLIAERDGAVS